MEKGGTEGEEQAKIAYKAARKDSDQAAEMAKGDKVSTALIDRVIFLKLNVLKVDVLQLINQLSTSVLSYIQCGIGRS